jgi:hypothetical protein
MHTNGNSFIHRTSGQRNFEKVAVVLAIGHALRAYEALGCPDALPGFLEVLHSLLEDSVFVGHKRSIRTSGIRSLDAFVFCRENPYMFRDAMLKLLLAETLPYAKLTGDS